MKRSKKMFAVVLILGLLVLAGCRTLEMGGMKYEAMGDQKLDKVKVELIPDPCDATKFILVKGEIQGQQSLGESPVMIEFFKTVQELAKVAK